MKFVRWFVVRGAADHITRCSVRDLYTRLRNSDQLTDALNWWCGWTRWLLLPHLSDRYLPPLPPQPPCCCKNQLGMANICWPRASDLDDRADRRVTIAVVQMLQPVFSTENDQWTLANVLVLRTVSNKLVAATITRRKVHGCDMKLSQTNITINETFPLISTTICVEWVADQLSWFDKLFPVTLIVDL